MEKRPFHVLVVEDDSAHALFITKSLTLAQPDISVWRARDGAEAMECLRRDTAAHRPLPDLILTDIRMPRMSGLELLAAIKGDAALRVVPTVVLTASDSASDIRLAYDRYANSYI